MLKTEILKAITRAGCVAGLMTGVMTAALASSAGAAGWSRVPGGLRLDGAIEAEAHSSFLMAFWSAALEEPRHAPIALWLAGDGGDEVAAVQIAIKLEEVKAQGVRIATVVPNGHACSGACNILFFQGDERFRTEVGSDLLVRID